MINKYATFQYLLAHEPTLRLIQSHLQSNATMLVNYKIYAVNIVIWFQLDTFNVLIIYVLLVLKRLKEADLIKKYSDIGIPSITVNTMKLLTFI